MSLVDLAHLVYWDLTSFQLFHLKKCVHLRGPISQVSIAEMSATGTVKFSQVNSSARVAETKIMFFDTQLSLLLQNGRLFALYA